MIRDILTQHPWFWALIWQSTACLAVGLVGSILLRRRPARAHQLLLLSLVAAILIPVLSHAVKQNQWGLFVAEQTVSLREAQPFFVETDPATAAPTPASDTAAGPGDPIVTPSETAAPAMPGFQWQTALPLLWIGATSALLLRLIARLFLGLSLVRRSAPARSRPIAQALDDAKARLEIEGDVVVRASDHARSPVIWCWGRRPILLIPSDACDNTRLDWPSIVCHELAHWKRRDHIAGLIAELTICLLPWQPFLWLARRRLVDLSEEACDDWVIASGQLGTRYARTLLSLTALGQAALIPAVGTSKTGLAARIRRIVSDECTNPRSGPRWTFATVLLTACITVCLAFAQTRLAQITRLVKTTASQGACVEQLASVVMIRGRILEPDGNPIHSETARVTALPMTSYSIMPSRAAEPDSRGYFELPWSAEWTNDDGTAQILVSDRTKNLATLVEIREPAASTTIRLEPALTFRGRVTDPNGQRIPKSAVIAFFDEPSRSQIPVAAERTDGDNEFKMPGLPRDHAYRLRFRAPNSVTKMLTLHRSQMSGDVIDVGTVVLEPRNPAKAVADDWPSDTEWRKVFEKAYRLEEGEVVKLVKPPFLPERQDYMVDMCLDQGGLDMLMDAWYLCGGFRWDGQLTRGTWYGGPGLPRIRSVLNWVLRIPDYDFAVPEELHGMQMPKGDWVVRDGASPEEKLAALEEIIRREMHRSIRFEKRTVERDTIVATGRYALTPLPDKDPNQFCLFINRDVPVSENGEKGEADSLTDLLHQLAEGINIAIDDRTDPVQTGKVQYVAADALMDTYPERVIDKENYLPALLDNIARQTGLQFTVEKQPAEVWFVVEDTAE
jgi:beta-lactamase regulating signal transducer with metallopeptidase domain